jgi:hypothetical protein
MICGGKMNRSVFILVLGMHTTAIAQNTAHLSTFRQTAHETALRSNVGDKTIAQRDGQDVNLFNRNVLVHISRTIGAWDAAWLGKTDAGIEGAGFALESNGNLLKLESSPIETKSFTNQYGSGIAATQKTGDQVQIVRTLRVYDGKPALTLSAKITNTSKQEISLGTARLINLYHEQHGAWHLGKPAETPAAIYGVSGTHWFSVPWQPGKTEQVYTGAGLLLLDGRRPSAALAVGFLSAREARPDLDAVFRVNDGGVRLLAHQPMLGRKLGPRETLEFDPIYLAADENPYTSLDDYAQAAASFARAPIRHKPTGIWCSWYAHRMNLSEELVLANAAVAAKYFKPLGFEIMQLDHGWQRGDVTGDWVPNERFPHGLKWLANELKTRYGFRLGLWIAPTDVAETSQTFQKHPDWMLKDGNGKPLVNWRWYWKPNPNCYELDASNLAAQRFIEETFSRLTGEGASYFKIDFIAASAGEQFFQSDPKITRGWGVFNDAVEAVRRGAGKNATIRYCQVPSLLAAGDSAYGGDDTLDAGLNGDIRVLRENAKHLATSYWANDRLYRREVCDMSVRMQADMEEARLRLAMMTLAGCSISFSDELQHLPASRIRMMQSCLPAGNPPMKPLDLFDREIPSIWHLHCRAGAAHDPIDEWDVVGVFNFENKPEARTIDFASLGLATDVDTAVFEFWEEKLLGVHRGKLTITLPPQTSRILSIRKLGDHPQLIGTDMHLLQGFHELKRLAWDESTRTLSGEFERAAGLDGKAFVYIPTNYAAHFDFPLKDTSAQLTRINAEVWAHEFHFKGARYEWKIPFDKSTK